MKIFTIISAVPEEHYKHQKGFSVVMETPKRGKQKDQIKVWLPEVQYNLAMFMQKHRILTQYLRKKDAEKFITPCFCFEKVYTKHKFQSKTIKI